MANTLVTGATTVNQNTNSASQAKSGQMMGNSMSNDFETFLRMLTVQMQNQDPLQPIESSDYAVQLATFSTLEQQALTNKLLSAMMNSTQSDSPMMALNDWVGLNVTSERKFQFDKEGIQMEMPDLSNSQISHLVIKNENGVVVDAQEIKENDDTFTWSNDELPSGIYSAEFKIYEDDKLLGTKPALIKGKVLEAQWRNGQIELLFAGDVRISAQSVVTATAKSEDKH